MYSLAKCRGSVLFLAVMFMNILAVESSAKVASCAMLENDKLIGEIYANCGLVHSKTLASMIQNLLNITGVSIQSIDVFAVSNGPGSFTGVRIGVAIVKGMALVLNKPVVGVSTLYAMAQNSVSLENFIICPVMGARVNQFYSAMFNVKNGKLCKILDDCAISADELFLKLKEYKNENIVLLGDGADIFYSYIQNENSCYVKGLDIKVMPAAFKYQSARGVAYAAEEILSNNEAAAVSAQQLQINYLRPSQAERELKMR